MAVSMDALLKIKADVSGEGAVQNLARGIGNLNKQAGEASKGFGGLLGSTNGLSGALQSLIPLASGAGIAALVKGSIDAADKMFDLSQKTGVSVEQLSKFNKAAKVSGTDIDSVGNALVKLAKSMQSAASVGQIGQMTKEEVNKAVEAVRDGERRQTDDVQRAADERVARLQRESDRRLKIIGRRYREEEKILNDRYDDQASQEEQRQQDLIDQRVEGIKREYQARIDAVKNNTMLSEAQKQQQVQLLQDQEESTVESVRRIGQRVMKESSRILRDQKQMEQDAIDDRRSKEEQAVRDQMDKEKKIVEAGAKSAAYSIQKAAKASVDALKGTSGAGDELSGELEDLGLSGGKAAEAFKTLGISVKNQNGSLRDVNDVFLEISSKFAAMADGPEKAALALKLFGRSGAEMIPMLNMGGSAIDKLAASMTTQFAKAADIFNDKNIMLAGKIAGLARQLAEAMMPALERVTDALIGFFDLFNKLPGWAKAATLAIGGLVLAWGPLVQILLNTIMLAKAIAALQLGATIAGWLGAVGPAIAGITAAFTGLLAWIGGTLIPGLLAFFSGPVGWTVLAVAAVVAMCIYFRKPIGQFLTWFGEAFMNGLKTIAGFLKVLWIDPWIGLWNNVLRGPVTALWSWLQEAAKWALGALYAIAYQIWVQPWINLWNNVLRQPVTAAWTWLQTTWKQVSAFFLNNVVKPLSTAWTVFTTTIQNGMRTAANVVIGVWNTVLGTVKNVIRGFLQGWANAINNVIGLVNRLINTFNLLPGPDIGTLGTVTVPAFAQGGMVSRPTVGLVGEAGPEYIIPASKMASASQRFLAGARGADVLSGGNAAAAPAQINITTGPVIEMDGQKYVSLADLEMAMRITADSVMGQLRTPSARISLGLA